MVGGNTRILVRASQEFIDLVQQGAALQGCTAAAFVRGSLIKTLKEMNIDPSAVLNETRPYRKAEHQNGANRKRRVRSR